MDQINQTELTYKQIKKILRYLAIFFVFGVIGFVYQFATQPKQITIDQLNGEIVFVNLEQFESTIQVVTSDGEELSVLDTHGVLPRTTFPLAWSPNGKQLAFTSLTDNNDDCLFIANESDTVCFIMGGFLPSWSPNNQYIAFLRQSDENLYTLQIINLITNEEQTVVNEQERLISFSWSPDSNNLVYTITKDGDSEIWLYSLSSDGNRFLLDGWSPAWSPLDEQIALTRSQNGDAEIWLYSVMGDESHFLVKGSEPAWSPDGQRIALVRNRKFSIYDLSSNEDIFLTPNNIEVIRSFSSFEWSSTGNKVLFVGRSSNELPDVIHIVDRDGKNLRSLDHLGDENYYPTWHPAN